MENVNNDVIDVVIIGAGPAGYTAAIYVARANVSSVVFTGFMYGTNGGQLMTTTTVENYPGFPNGVDGKELMGAMEKQAVFFGSSIIYDDVVDVDFSVYPYKIFYGFKRKEVLCNSVIICTGATAKRLDVEGTRDNELWQKGVSTCAVCDGALPIFRNGHVLIIGGGDTAMEEAIFMTKFASKVTVIHRSNKFKASKIMLDRARKHEKISFLEHYILEKVLGEKIVSKAIVRNLITDETTEIDINGVFLAIGHTPNTWFLNGKVKTDEHGYIITHDLVKTSIDGVFAAGDVVDKKYRQAIKAAGDGCAAALEAIKFVDALQMQSQMLLSNSFHEI